LRKALPHYPLPLIHRLLRQGQVTAGGKPCKAKDRIDCGVKITIPSLKTGTDEKQGAKAENQRLKIEGKKDYLTVPSIIWEGCGLIAFNKPPGLAVHGPCSLDTIVRSYFADKLPHSLSFKPGPLHRLDKPSSGIIVFSASLDGARLFSSLMHEQKVKKIYLAIIEGKMKKETIWQDNLVRDKEKKKSFVSKTDIKGKTAITKVTPLAAKDNYTLIKAEITTGRTHQIRAQAAAHGHPLAGDIKYGGKIIKKQGVECKGKKAEFFLHAWKLEFLEHSIEAPLPPEMLQSLNPNSGFTVKQDWKKAFLQICV
jgi:23S rRNA pseudouridine955/2504/2580 synthase